MYSRRNIRAVEPEGNPEDKLLCCVNPVESWTEHYTSRGWNTLQNKLDAGYTLYAEPTPLTGSYEKDWDFGTSFNSIVVNLTWNQTIVKGSVMPTPSLATSTDGVTYTPLQPGTSVFGSDTQFVRTRFDFTSANDKSLLIMQNIRLRLDIKFSMDAGSDEVVDAQEGKETFFNIPFKDVQSITVTPDSTESTTAVVEFLDVPYPTGFRVHLYGVGGGKVTGKYFWKARGVL